MKSPCKLPRPLYLLLALISLLWTNASFAETASSYPDNNDSSTNNTIAIPIGSQSENLRKTLLLPEFGQSMTSVEDRLGTPQQAATIGTPAITTWKYKDMTVYFEGKTVIRTVVHYKPLITPQNF